MIVLQHEGNVIQLKMNEFPERSLDLKTTFRRDMNGLLRGWTQRPHVLIHDVTVYLLTFEKYEALRTFVFAAQGDEITYTDDDGVIHQVRLLTEPVTIEQPSITHRTTTLQFEEIR